MASTRDTGQQDDNISSPLKDLYRTNAPATYVYPQDLGNNGDPYLVFRRVRYNREKRLDLSTRELLTSFYLPIPANLGVQYGANYSNIDLGVAGQKISQFASDPDTGMWEAVGQGWQTTKELIPRFAKNALQTFGETAGVRAREGIELGTGVALNSHLAALFEDVGFRSHEFNYKLIARNYKESLDIRNMIQLFKYAMHPSFLETKVSKTNVFEYPDEWYIHFRKGYRENLYDFAPCVLTNFSVQYNGSNVPVFYEDTKAPVDIDITLQFQEVEILTKEKIENEFTNRGAFGQVSGSSVSRGQDTSPASDGDTRTLEERRNSSIGLI
ncbi:hypothetical protein [Methanohalobium sp.]|uniref:hypothetical protein n=1 Tax=Methanohalobium sp. TaxID=2837493 RepID=UPI0025EE45FE|nr:hypothetical protein [Methanohalobium sp.]